jgi:hypothetical protein
VANSLGRARLGAAILGAALVGVSLAVCTHVTSPPTSTTVKLQPLAVPTVQMTPTTPAASPSIGAKPPSVDPAGGPFPGKDLAISAPKEYAARPAEASGCRSGTRPEQDRCAPQIKRKRKFHSKEHHR